MTKHVTSDPNRKKTFSEWISENGGTGTVKDAQYYSDLSDAASAYAKALPTYGAAGEALGKNGLTGSGYEKYLLRLASRNKKAAEAQATDDYYDRKRKNFDLYEKYIADYTAEQQSIFKRVFADLRQKGVADADKAFAYAVGAGLNESSAHKVAESGASAAEAKLRSDAASYIYKNKLDREEAKAYALSLGLSQSDAEQLAQYAKESAYNRTIGDAFLSTLTPNEYVEYLRALEKHKLLE